MARTVKVGLEVDEAPFVRGMERAERAAEKLDDALDDVAGSAKASAAATESAKESTEDLGASAKDSGRALSSLRDDAAKLDKQIDETSKSIRELARQIAATSDEAERVDLTKKLHIDQRVLREQLNLRKLMEVEADEAARGFVARFGGSIGPLMASMPIGPGAAVAGGLIAAAMAPTLLAGIAGAVVGGVGVGGVIGGVLLAARDERVKAAGADLGEFLLGDLEKRAAGFAPEVLDSISLVRSAWMDMGSDLDRVFASSRFMEPLVSGAMSGAKKIVAGVADIMDNADPAVDALSRSFDELGDAVGDTFSLLAEDADEGASALDDLTLATSNLIRTVGGLVHLAAAVKGYTDELDVAIDKGRFWIEQDSYIAEKLRGLGIQLDLTADGFKAGSVEAEAYKAATLGTADAADFAVLKAAGMTDAQIAAADASGKYRSATEGTASALRGLAGEAISGEEAIEELKSTFDDIFNTHMSYDRAVIASKDGTKELNKELREGKRTLNENSQAGRDNRDAVLDQIEKVNGLRDAMIRQGKPMDEVNGKYRDGIAKIREKLEKMGFEKTEIDKLIGKYEEIPEQVSTRVTADTAQAEQNLADVRTLIAQIKSKRVVITTDYYGRSRTRSEGRNVPIGDVGGRRWGGVVEHAQWGTLREAQIASPVAPARYAWAEPATGGEAFIPKYGNRERSLDILATAARWYGQQIMPAGGGGGGGGAVTFDNRITVQPLQANFTVADLSALQARQDALSRVGRPR